MIVITQSGSRYEIDQSKTRVRRLMGTNNPTPIQGADGEWKEYSYMLPVEITVGHTMCFVWKESVPGYVQPATYTSNVVEIDPITN